MQSVFCWLVTLAFGANAMSICRAATLSASDQAAIASLEDQVAAALRHKDLDALMSLYAPGSRLFVYNLAYAEANETAADERAYWRKTFEAATGPIEVSISKLSVRGDEHVAFGHHLQHFVITLGGSKQLDMLIRVSTGYEKSAGRWYIVEEHDSLPISVVTGKAIFLPEETSANHVAALPAFELPLVFNGTGTISDKTFPKPAFLNFFATWCPPCQEEAPDVARLAAEFSKRGVSTIGVNALEEEAQGKAFAMKFHLAFPIALDKEGGLLKQFTKGGSLPCAVFIDKSGAISAVVVGALKREDLRRHFEAIATTP